MNDLRLLTTQLGAILDDRGRHGTQVRAHVGLGFSASPAIASSVATRGSHSP